MNRELLNKIMKAEGDFAGTPFADIVKEAWSKFNTDNAGDAELLLEKLPTPEKLLSTLFEKLKGKAVFKTLKRIEEGKANTPEDYLLCLSSLMTHIIIECKEGHVEYKMLLPIIEKRIREMVADIM